MMSGTSENSVISVMEALKSENTSGMAQFGLIGAGDIKTYSEIRDICRGNTCGNYGKTWACPPGSGTLEECREILRKYESAVVFSGKYGLEDCYDFEGMMRGHRSFKKLCDIIHKRISALGQKHLLLSNEGCTRCEKCTYPDTPCRMPELLFPSVEGFGINVSQLAAAAKIAYNNGVNTVTYLGVLLF